MKEIRKTVISLIVLAICYGLARATGFSLDGLISNIYFNAEAILQVVMIVAFLSAVRYLLKLLVSLLKNEKTATFVTLARSAIDYLSLVLMVVWSLRLLGADINGVIAGLGILALIIGTSAEGIIEDMLTGIFMLFEGECKVGDIIEVDGFLGKVTEIGIRTTTLVDGAGNEKIFNNSSMKDILNRSSRLSMAVVDISLPPETDVDKVLSADYGDVRCLGLEEIGAEDLTVRFVKETEEENIYDTKREMNVAILQKLKELGIK